MEHFIGAINESSNCDTSESRQLSEDLITDRGLDSQGDRVREGLLIGDWIFRGIGSGRGLWGGWLLIGDWIFLFGFRRCGYWCGSTSMSDDAALLRRYAESRSEEAFAELVRRHLNLVYFAALRSAGGNGPLAEDVAQEVFTVLARQAGALARHATLVGWLYTTTRFTTAKAVRSERRRKRREQEAHLMMEASAENEAAAEWERLRPLLDDALEELNGREREVILLRCLEGQAFAEIGATLRVSEDAARMRVERALEKLRALLARRGVTSTGAALGVLLAEQATAAVAPVGLAGSVVTAAVGAGAAGTGTATGIFAFMSTIKLSVGVTGVVALLVMVGVATYQRQARETAERALTTARQEQEASFARLRAKESQVRAVGRETMRLQKELDEARARLAAAAKPVPPAAWDAEEAGAAFVARHPQVKRAFDELVSARLRFQFGPMYQALGWSNDRIERFEAAQGQLVAVPALLDGEGTAIIRHSGKFSQHRYVQRFNDAFGDFGKQGVDKFNEEMRDGPARNVAADVASALYFTDTPLTPEQAEQVTQILAGSRNSGPAAKVSAYDWNAVMTKAEGVLSAPQLAVIAAKRANDLFKQALNRSRSPVVSPSSAPAGAGK